MNQIKEKILKADLSYLKLLESFTIRDSIVALLYYVFILVIYYVMGRIMFNSGKYYGAIVNIILIIIPIIIVRKMFALGLCKRNLKISLMVSGAIGLLFLLVNTIIPSIVMKAKLLPLDMILTNMVYYFIIIALSEEVSFRGYIQPRLYPLVKREWLMILIGGILFVFMHFPFQMAARGMNFTEYFPQFIANAPFQFLWHLAFTELYRLYGNIFGSTLLHGLIDMSMGLFE